MSDQPASPLPAPLLPSHLSIADWNTIAAHFWSLPAALSITETATGRVIAVNPAFERISGFPAADLLGRSTVDIGFYCSPRDRTELLRALSAEDRFDASEVTFRTANGELRTAFVSCRRMRDDHRDQLLTLFVDVTTRKRMELSLRESEERYRRFFHESIDPIVILQWHDATGFGSPVEVNDSMVELLGYSRSELLAMTVEQWEGPFNQVPLAELADQLRRHRTLVVERLCERADGRPCIVEFRCGIMRWQGHEYVLAHLRDITARRRMEETLELNEAGLRVALTATNVTLFRTDRYLRVTWSFNPSQGYSTTFDHEPTPPEGAFPPDRSRIGRLLTKVMQTGVGARDEINLLRNGVIRVHEMVVEPLKDAAGVCTGVTSAVIDISARKAAENELRAAMQRFELITESAPVGIFRTDAAGLVTHVNPAAQEITGLSLTELQGRHLLTFVAAEDLSMATALWQRIVDGSREEGQEVRVLRPDGSIRWVFAQVRAIFAGKQFEQAVGTITDITERRQTHEMLKALVESRTLPGSLLANGLASVARQLAADFGCFVLPGEGPRCTLRALWRDGAVVENLSESAAACPCVELLGDSPRLITADLARHVPHTVAHWAPGCTAALVTPLPAPQQGTVGHLCLLWRTPPRDEATLQRLVQLVILPFVSEIAREREAEERRQIERRLLQSQKFEALGALAGGIAHDFNNVLTTILNNATLAQSRTRTPEQREACIEEILHASHRAGDLVRQILSFGRRQHDGSVEERTPLHLRSVIEDALRFLRPAISPSITIERHYDPATPLIRGQATQMYQVLMNVCVNAAQAIGDRVGCIRLRLEPCALDATSAATLPPLPLGLYVKCSIEDTGGGIPPEALPHLFEPFFTTKANGGTGLGLALVQKIVADHGGAVTVQSEVGHGARFTLYLPAEDKPAVTGPAPAAPACPGGHGEHLLLVDDERAVLRSCKQLLEELGYRVTEFSDAAKALAAFWVDPAQFDAAILDHRMPTMTGAILAEYLSHARPDLPIALVSGHPGELAPDALQASGCIALLTKPLSLCELAVAVNLLLQHRPSPPSP